MPKYSEDIAEVKGFLKDLNDRSIRTEDNTGFLTKEMKELKGDVKEIRRVGITHITNHPPPSNSRFSRNEKFLGLGGGTGVVGLIAYAILQQLGWLPVGG